MVKRFFYVCVGIFLLAAAYNLGVVSAGAQSPILEGADAGGGSFTASINRVVWMVDGTGTHRIAAPIPGTASVLNTIGGGSGASASASAILDNGDCYFWPSGGSSWVLYGNLLVGGPTPASAQTWGSLKTKYR